MPFPSVKRVMPFHSVNPATARRFASFDEHDALAVREMVKTLRSARDEVAKCALACRHFATHGPASLAPDPSPGDGLVRYDPIGVLPWSQ